MSSGVFWLPWIVLTISVVIGLEQSRIFVELLSDTEPARADNFPEPGVLGHHKGPSKGSCLGRPVGLELYSPPPGFFDLLVFDEPAV